MMEGRKLRGREGGRKGGKKEGMGEWMMEGRKDARKEERFSLIEKSGGVPPSLQYSKNLGFFQKTVSL